MTRSRHWPHAAVTCGRHRFLAPFRVLFWAV